jgi:hypothetical protein
VREKAIVAAASAASLVGVPVAAAAATALAIGGENGPAVANGSGAER